LDIAPVSLELLPSLLLLLAETAIATIVAAAAVIGCLPSPAVIASGASEYERNLLFSDQDVLLLLLSPSPWFRWHVE
jgi:hypothetical protein